MRSTLVFLELGATLLACGSSTGSASLSGTVAMTSFAVASQVATLGPDESVSCSNGLAGQAACASASSGQSASILLTSVPGLTCGAVVADVAGTSSADFDLASSASLTLTVVAPTGSLSVGTYDITTSVTARSAASALVSTTTALCGAGLNVFATAGSVTLTSVSPTEVAGSYLAIFGVSGSFSGSFDIPICDIPDGGGISTVSLLAGPCQQ